MFLPMIFCYMFQPHIVAICVNMGNFTFKVYNAMTIIVCALRDILYYMRSHRAHTTIVIALYTLNVKLTIFTQKPEDGHNVWPKHVPK
jgi:hypothetical protein